MAQAFKARRPALPAPRPASADDAPAQPATASQTLRFHLNKVAWWLDMQPEHSIHAPAASNLSEHNTSNMGQAPLSNKGQQSTADRKLPGMHMQAFSGQVSHTDQDIQGASGRQVRWEDYIPPTHILPTASTELFLQLEAASQQDAEQPSNPALRGPGVPMPVGAAQQIVQLLSASQQLAALPSTGAADYSVTEPQACSTVAGPVIKGQASVVQQQLIANPHQQEAQQASTLIWPNAVHSQKCIAGPAEQSPAAEAKHAQQAAFGHPKQAHQAPTARPKQAQQATPDCAKHAEHAELSCPKAAEAPFVREGSYAVAAQEAKARSLRQQQQLQQLTAEQEQAKAEAASSRHAARQARLLATPPLAVSVLIAALLQEVCKSLTAEPQACGWLASVTDI